MAFATLALVLALLIPAPQPTDGCADIHIIGARGSGQAEGFGEQVGPVVDALADMASERAWSVTVEALDYPAISVSDSFGLVLINGEYEASLTAGVYEMWAAIGRMGRACPVTDIILVGYSQGAQVIKLGLEDSRPSHRIASVVLLADPTRDPSQIGIARLGDPTTDRSGAFAPIALPPHLRAVAVDVCAAGDGVCERGRRGFTAHTDGYFDAPSQVLPFVLADLGQHLLARPYPR